MHYNKFSPHSLSKQAYCYWPVHYFPENLFRFTHKWIMTDTHHFCYCCFVSLFSLLSLIVMCYNQSVRWFLTENKINYEYISITGHRNGWKRLPTCLPTNIDQPTIKCEESEEIIQLRTATHFKPINQLTVLGDVENTIWADLFVSERWLVNHHKP